MHLRLFVAQMFLIFSLNMSASKISSVSSPITSTALRLPECEDRPSADGVSPLLLPRGSH